MCMAMCMDHQHIQMHKHSRIQKQPRGADSYKTHMSLNTLTTVDTNVPVGYVVPEFPSLHFPIGSPEYDVSFLYYTNDIWRFTFLWSIIFSFAFHGGAAVVAILSHRKVMGAVWILLVYGFIAGIYGIISGTVSGFLLAAIYRAGMFSMSTWIPFAWGLMMTLYLVITSYSMMAAIL